MDEKDKIREYTKAVDGDTVFVTEYMGGYSISRDGYQTTHWVTTSKVEDDSNG